MKIAPISSVSTQRAKKYSSVNISIAEQTQSYQPTFSGLGNILSKLRKKPKVEETAVVPARKFFMDQMARLSERDSFEIYGQDLKQIFSQKPDDYKIDKSVLEKLPNNVVLMSKHGDIPIASLTTFLEHGVKKIFHLNIPEKSLSIIDFPDSTPQLVKKANKLESEITARMNEEIHSIAIEKAIITGKPVVISNTRPLYRKLERGHIGEFMHKLGIKSETVKDVI